MMPNDARQILNKQLDERLDLRDALARNPMHGRNPTQPDPSEGCISYRTNELTSMVDNYVELFFATERTLR